MPAMSPARTPEPHPRFNPPSLLQTRSLRDLRTPPPLPKSSAQDKSRRRLLQVNGPYVVPEVSPPAPGIGEPRRLELVQAPYVSSQSPTSSTQLSPSVAATRPSSDAAPSPAISQYTQRRTHPKSPSSPDAVADQRSRRPVTERAMPFPDRELTRGLRNPPIHPRKARPYCSDFGLGRDGFEPPPVARPLPSPPVPDNSSLASSPLPVYIETETDSDTSSVDNPLDFSFPQPPSIDESLHVRRMRSSRMFSSEEADTVKEYLRKRWGGFHSSGLGGSPGEGDDWGRAGNVKSNSGLPSDRGHRLDLKRPTIHRIIATQSLPRALLEGERASPTPSTAEERDACASTALPPPSSRTDTSRKRSTTTQTPRDVRPHPASPSLSRARSVSSARNEANPLPRSAPRTPIISPSQTSIRLPSELSERLDRLDLSIEKLKAHEPQSRRGVVAVPWQYQVQQKPQALLPLSPPSLASAGRRKPVHRSYVSVPLAGLGLANITDRPHESLRTLGAPFNHRSTRSQPAIQVAVQHREQPMPKSFIDITPEQEIRRKSSRTRVRKLLARASIGVLGWGKHLAGKKSTSK